MNMQISKLFRQQCRNFGTVAIAFLMVACNTANEPVPKAWLGENTLFTSYTESPKTLDSVSSYSNNETPWTYAVYEPPLKYHYLKRPYELEPRSLQALPTVTYLDKHGKVLVASAGASQIAESVFELKIKPGIRFQPHPAFASNDKGQPLYLNLAEDDLKDKRSPFSFEKMGSRELTADDYVYAIRRLATPRVKSPSFGFLSEKIVGLADYGKQIKKVNEQVKSGKSAREAGVFGHLPWLDFRPNGETL